MGQPAVRAAGDDGAEWPLDACPPQRRRGRAAFEVLTAAALLLPGLACTGARAQVDNELTLQTGHYREGARPIGDIPGSPRPLSADTRLVTANLSLAQGQGLSIRALQDTWSGATPITTAPVSARGNRPVRAGSVGQLVTVGASPMINGNVLLDRQDRVMAIDPASGLPQAAPGLVHTLSTASPETRQQLDLKWLRPVADGAWTVAAGVSHERDFRAHVLSLGRRLDLNQKLTTLSLDLSHTRNDIAATLDHDALPYITRTAYRDRIDAANGLQVLRGRRHDVAAAVGLTQVLSPSALFEASLVHSRSRGYQANPYRVMSVIFAPPAAAGEDLRNGELRALLEQRPDSRRQWTASVKLVLHQAGLDAAWHLSAGAFRDDWGVRAQRLELEWFQPLGEGLMLMPRLRYYTQRAARFHSPLLVSHQAFRQVRIGDDGQPVIAAFDPAQLPAHFSSDPRLGSFGSLAVGLGLSWQLGRGTTLDLGLDSTRQSGSLKWGGGGDGSYADLRHLAANAALRIDLDGPVGGGAATADDHAAHARHGAWVLPPGLMAAHAAPGPGAMMLTLRQTLALQGGPLRHGRDPVDDAELVARACGPQPCAVRPQRMRMRMHMLDLMIGLNENLSLMLMPQHMDMTMDTQLIPGSVATDTALHFGRHENSGRGDTQLHLLFSTDPRPGQRWVLGLGLSAPTGSTDARHRRSHQQLPAAMDYGMQTGSGTWDLMPSLSVMQSQARWTWGGQLGLVRRLQSYNHDGYAWASSSHVDGWIGYRMAPQWAASLRVTHRVEAAVRGSRQEPAIGQAPADHAANQGGRFTDLGLGLRFAALPGTLRDTSLGLEWMQPLDSHVNGYQLTRRGSLSLSWSLHF